LHVSGWGAALNSLRTASDAPTLAMFIGVLASVVVVALRRTGGHLARGMSEMMGVVVLLPLGVSAVTVGFGYLVTFSALPGDLRTSPLLVPLAQALGIIPLVVRSCRCCARWTNGCGRSRPRWGRARRGVV
jgi:thiamine transport system permease protein